MRAWLDHNRDRFKAGAATVALQLVFGYVLIHAFSVSAPRVIDDAMKVFNLAPDPPPPPPHTIPSPRKISKPTGAASPRNLWGRATSVAAPQPIIPLNIPPPIIVAKAPDIGAQTNTGSSDRPGPGTGAGGIGTGRGSGGSGDGEGSGMGTPLRWLKGRLKSSDYPEKLYSAGIGGTVSVRFQVGADGRVSRCLIARSSGNTELDNNTCRLIMLRYRFEPPRDENGRPLTATVEEDHEWIPHPQ